MNVPRTPHPWKVTPTQAVRIQRRLASRVVAYGRIRNARWVGGADAAFTHDGDACVAAVVVWDAREQVMVEQAVAIRPLRFPYVPGLLSFRELPALLAALRKLEHTPDVFMLDGQGVAHPRRLGLASHAGIILDRPTLGCAKSALIGSFDMPGPCAGDVSPLMDGDERIGTVVRTRAGVRPVFVSVGHKLALDEAVRLVLRCCTRYRLPEPTRLADRIVTRAKAEFASR